MAAVALTVALAAGSLGPSHAYAGFTSCQSDPVVTLSNGASVDLEAHIADSGSDVRQVSYTLHVPAGTRVVSVVNTDGLIGLAETVQVYADDAANTYDSSTVVTTGQQGVAVTAFTTVVSPLGLTLGSATRSGTSGQSLALHFTSLL
jgi:hypothetical protein